MLGDLMSEHTTLTFYQLCKACNIDGLIETFWDVFDTSGIDMDYAYYMVYSRRYEISEDISPILEWLLKIDPTIDVDRFANDYMVDEHLPNNALLLACELGHYEVVKWIFTEEPYLSSFKNRCYICDAFIVSCCIGKLDSTKFIFDKLSDYIRERPIILDEAYKNAMTNQHVETAEWLLEITSHIHTTT